VPCIHCLPGVLERNDEGSARCDRLTSVLTFVDIAAVPRDGEGGTDAGSAVKDRARALETRSLAASRAAFAACITALGTRRRHVPFNDAKLTRVLRAVLAGDACATTFVACVSERLVRGRCSS
jgi:hypothetical protein